MMGLRGENSGISEFRGLPILFFRFISAVSTSLMALDFGGDSFFSIFPFFEKIKSIWAIFFSCILLYFGVYLVGGNSMIYICRKIVGVVWGHVRGVFGTCGVIGRNLKNELSNDAV